MGKVVTIKTYYKPIMNNTILTIGIIVLALGVIGAVANFYIGLMLAVMALGVIGIVWGWLAEEQAATMEKEREKERHAYR
jgi:ABC-type transport system involved in cytochrome bd biosynthesis fused ATPase/permease subunit